MEIARLEPFPLVITYSDLENDSEYNVVISDDHSNVLENITATSDGSGNLAVTLTDYFSKYDDEYMVQIFDADDVLVVLDTLTIMRPYVIPSSLATTEEELISITDYEMIARAIINSITGGFKYTLERIEAVGLGTDYLSLPYRLNKILQVYENNVLVYDSEDPEFVNIREYYITPDKATISVVYQGAWDRRQGNSVDTELAASDSFTLHNTNDSPNIIQARTGVPAFPNGWDYTVNVEAGWPIIPLDIKQATTLIINDIKCNNLPYVNQYISEYKSDQFNIKFSELAFKDTGNRIADRILSAYVRPIYRLGVL
jgi:hypothetical protein